VYSSFASNCTIDKQVQQQQRQREFKREKAVDSISQSVQLHPAFLPLFDLFVRILTMGVRPTLSARFSVIEGGWCSRVMVNFKYSGKYRCKLLSSTFFLCDAFGSRHTQSEHRLRPFILLHGMPILSTQDAPGFSEQRCTEELEHVLNYSSKAKLLIQGIFALNKRSLVKGITCRSCAGTEQQVRQQKSLLAIVVW